MDFKKFSNLIMIEQTLFALPFALIGLVFAGGTGWETWLWTVVALTAARTAGMSFNRVIDAEIDAENPRTRDRLVPRGEVKKSTVWILAAAASLVLIGSSFMLNRLCFYLSFAAVTLLFTYSYFKRFSSSSHFYLGFVEAAAPVGGYLAVTGAFALLPFVLGAAIMLWIAGLDIVYALQDVDFDAGKGLHSLPVRLGKKWSLAASTLCYVLALGAMAAAGLMAGMKIPYWIAVGCVAVIFTYQQVLSREEDILAAMKKFFRANMLISPLLLAGAFVSVYLW